MKDQIFASYSRDQLYFAESLVHALQEQNFNIWFDLQQLEPGADWGSEIKSALRASSRVILIASRSSLQSPYVALEWMHALERHKPIYVVLFEEVEFKDFTTELKGEMMLVPLNKLRIKAKATIDGRGNFKKSVKRLSESLTSTTKSREPIPSVNRLKIPQCLPLPVAFIAATMAFLTGIALALTVTVFSAYLPMVLAGCIATAYCGLQTWEFLQRKSYQGTRVVLAIAPIITYLFAFWFSPIALGAFYLAVNSDDVHRWSPRGEGNNPRDRVLKRKRAVWHQVLQFLVFGILFYLFPVIVWLGMIIWFALRKRNYFETHRRGDIAVALLILSTLLALIDPLIAIPCILVTTVIAHQRQKPLGRIGSVVNVTYMIHAQEEDAHIVEDIRNAMEYVGLKRVHSSKRVIHPDYHLVVISNFGTPPSIEELKAKGGKIIVVVASSLTEWERVQAYSEYQWVDYRRQDPERLVAMARDLQANRESNSFYTRIVPNSFERLAIPGRVFLFALIQLLFFNVFLFKVSRGIATGEHANLVLLIFSVFSLVVGFWILEKVLDRRITALRIAQINIGMVFALNILSLVAGLIQPLPAGYQINTEFTFGLLLVNGVSIIIFYRFAIYQVNAILKWWLPPFIPAGKSRPNKQVYQAALVSGSLSVLLSVSFFGPDIPVSHDKIPSDQTKYKHVAVWSDFSMDVPEHWLVTPLGVRDDDVTPYVLNVPISTVLLKANGPSNPFLARAINFYFHSSFASKGLIFGLLDYTGELMQQNFDKITFSLSPDSYPWQPEYYGFPVHSIVYVPDGKLEDTLTMTVWLFDPPDTLDFSIEFVDSVVTHSGTAPNTLPAQQSLLPPNIHEFNSQINAIQLKEDPGKTVVVVSLDSSDSDYYVTISGPDQVLQENKFVLEHILESISK